MSKPSASQTYYMMCRSCRMAYAEGNETSKDGRQTCPRCGAFVDIAGGAMPWEQMRWHHPGLPKVPDLGVHYTMYRRGQSPKK